MDNFVFSSDVITQDLGDGIKRRVLAHSDNIMMVEMHFEEGSIGALHSHPHEQITYVLEGEFEFTIGDQKKIVKKGDCLYKEPNVVHGAVALKKGMLIDTFTPCRKDYL